MNGSTYQVALGNGTKVFFDIDVDSNETVTYPTPTVQIGLTPVKTIKGAALGLAVLSTINDQTVKSNRDDTEVAVIQLDAVASGKDIDVKKLGLFFIVGDNAGVATSISDLDSCELFDGSTSVSNSINVNTATEIFNLSGVTVTAGTVKALSLHCDISDKFDPTDTIDVNFNITMTNHEAKDGSEDVTITAPSPNVPAAIVITAASIVDSVNAEPAVVAVKTGETVELGTVEIDANDVDGTITKLPLTVTGNTFLSADRKVELYSGSTHVANAYFTTTTLVVEN